ncbi:unnamed protein product [Diamesa hyperborea]
MKLLFCVLLIQLSSNFVSCSAGDKSPYYHNCISICTKQNCKQNHLFDVIKKKKLELTTLENLVQWNCRDECKYECMHKTTDAFEARNWNIPQFHGKWPFIRLLGVQEPASVVFSALNFYVHYKMLQEFRSEVRPDSPLYKLWHGFSLICMNGWTWSIVFHTRDYPITELFDYVFAYSMVLSSFCCMIIRMIHSRSKKLIGFIAFMFLLFFLNHFLYLSFGTFDYSYNMMVNIVTGLLGGIGWLIWCITKFRKRPYVWKMIVFVILGGGSLVLEVYDFPPVFKSFDAHSLWHLSSAPITIIFYKFIKDDCKALRKEMLSSSSDDDDRKKLI